MKNESTYQKCLTELQGPTEEERERRKASIRQDEKDLAEKENENV